MPAVHQKAVVVFIDGDIDRPIPAPVTSMGPTMAVA